LWLFCLRILMVSYAAEHGCNGQDKVKDRQGKPVKREVNGCGEESR
jgi:hypothetical protein